MGAIWSGFIGFMEQALLWFSMLTGSTGLGIILFTICARLLILPLTLTSIRSSRKMQELQPMIKELQRKYGKDKQKLQQETVKLYQEYKVNPAGSCLPMLLQLPIFIGVYWAVLHLLDPTYQESLTPAVAEKLQDPAVQEVLARPFLGLDLGTKPFGGESFTFENFQGVQFLILPVLAITLQFTQQIMAMPRVQDPQQRMMSKMMLFMPLFFAYITMIFPAGAVLYWVTSSTVGIVQQYFTSGWGSLANHLKFLPPDKRAKEAALATDGSPVAPSLEKGKSSGDAAAVPAATHQPRKLMDVLRPLIESAPDMESAAAPSSAGAASVDVSSVPATATSSAGGSAAPSPRRDVETARRQKQQTTSRRSRRRR